MSRTELIAKRSALKSTVESWLQAEDSSDLSEDNKDLNKDITEAEELESRPARFVYHNYLLYIKHNPLVLRL